MDPNAHAAARSQAIELLCQAQARGDLSVEAFEVRFGLIQQATNAASIEAIVADLMPRTPATPVPVPVDRQDEQRYQLKSYGEVTPAEFAAVGSGEEVRIAAVFGSTKRSGPWDVPPLLKLLIIAGGITLDFREALFETDFVDIGVSSFAGDITLIVPLEAQVENECDAPWSSVKHSRSRKGGFEEPEILIRLHGTVWLTELKIKERAPRPPPVKRSSRGIMGWFERMVG